MDEPDVPAAPCAIALPKIGFDAEDATYFFGGETVLPRSYRGLTPWLDRVFALMMRTATGAASHFRVPPERAVEIGTQVEL